MATKLLILSLHIVGVLSFTPSEGISSSVGRRVTSNLSTKVNLASKAKEQGCSSKKRCNPCPESDDDPDMDRREATLAMLGSLWAAGAMPAAMLTGNAQPAIAEYGTDAKLELPNPMGQMRDRANKQCLMESLGTRECLVYEDPDNKLYQNPDTKVLVERVEKAGEALATIPELIEKKSWIQITGVLTGPMGTLANSMDLLSKASDNPSATADQAKRVKTDLYAIAGAVDRRNGGAALEYHKLATEHLVDYIKSL